MKRVLVAAGVGVLLGLVAEGATDTDPYINVTNPQRFTRPIQFQQEVQAAFIDAGAISGSFVSGNVTATTVKADFLDAGVACINGATQILGPIYASGDVEMATNKYFYLNGPTDTVSLRYVSASGVTQFTGIADFSPGLYVESSGILGPLAGGSPAPLLFRATSANNQLALGEQLDTQLAYTEPIAHLHEVLNGGTAKAWWDINGYLSLQAPAPVQGRQLGWWSTAGNTAATTFTAAGTLPAPTSPTGTATAQPALTSATRMYIQYAGTAASNDVTGLNGGSFTQTRPVYRPKAAFRWRTDSAITSRRVWTGITESTLATLAVAAGPSASAIDFVAVGYEAGVNSGNFMCCSGDGTNYSCVDFTTPVTTAVSTEYLTIVDWTTSGTLVCCALTGTQAGGYSAGCVEKTTNLSTNVTGLGLYAANTTTNSAAQNFQISSASLEQN